MSSATVHPQNNFSVEESPSQSKHSTSRLSQCLVIFAVICATLLVVLSIIIIPIVLTSKGKQDPIIEMDNAATRSIINLHPWLHIRPKLSLLLKPTTTSTSKSENMNSTTMKETKTDVARTNTAYKLFSSSHFKSQSSLFDQTSTSSNGSLNTSSPPSVVSTTGTITNSSMKLVMLNNVKDTMFNVYNTTAGEITSGFYSMSTSHSYSLQHAMDNQTSTSYFTDESMDGINSGFIVIPAIYNAIVACAIRFATGNRTSMYDPIPVTLERSEDIDIDTLLYNNT